jgi:hypothetical protein
MVRRMADRMVDLEKSLSALSNAAKRLNDKSNNINEIIGRVEKRLEEAQAGLEFWPGWQLDASDGLTTELGYGKRGGGGAVQGKVPLERWQFLLRLYRTTPSLLEVQQIEEQRHESGNDEIEFEPVLVRETPLLQASRGDRIEALKQLPPFIDAYCKQIEKMAKTIEEAEESLK